MLRKQCGILNGREQNIVIKHEKNHKFDYFGLYSLWNFLWSKTSNKRVRQREGMSYYNVSSAVIVISLIMFIVIHTLEKVFANVFKKFSSWSSFLNSVLKNCYYSDIHYWLACWWGWWTFVSFNTWWGFTCSYQNYRNQKMDSKRW